MVRYNYSASDLYSCNIHKGGCGSAGGVAACGGDWLGALSQCNDACLLNLTYFNHGFNRNFYRTSLHLKASCTSIFIALLFYHNHLFLLLLLSLSQ